MQSNLTQLQYQQLQIQQQQQRLASMMQQKQRNGQPWDDKQLLLQKQRLGMMRPTSMIPNRPRLSQPSVVPSTSPAKLPEAKTIPVETEAQKRNLKQYQERDDIYQDTLNLQHKRHIELAQSKKRAIELASMERRTRMQHGPAAAFGPGYRGYANGKTGTQSRIRFPHEKKRKRESFRFSLESLQEQATKEETLVPIRIELEHEGYKLRDTFTWNLNESLVTPEQFADVMCEDLRLPVSIFSDQIAKAIREQMDDYNLNASSMIKQDEPKQQQKELLDAIHQPDKLISYPQEEGIELRTVIKLDITVGNWELIDQFEWDIGCPKNSPEEFAAKLVKDLGLGGEFKTAIAHSIREQIHVYIKSLLLVGYEFNSASMIDDEIKPSFLPQLTHIVRDYQTVERFTPSVIELSDVAVEKMEKDRMREARRKRRGTRARRGIVLPDREPQKTHRTGFAVAPEQEMTDEQLLNQGTEQSNKRSAALKARMNIAAEAANTGDDLLDNQPIGFNRLPMHLKPQYQAWTPYH